MFKNGKISVDQFRILVILFSIGTTILLVPGAFAKDAKQDAWIASILGLGIGLLLVFLYSALGQIYPKLTLFQLCERILGKWFGKTISFLFFSYFFITCPFLLRQIADFMTIQFMIETPVQAIMLIFMFVIIMGTRLGLESFARSAEIFFPWIILLLTFITLGNLNQIELKNIQPILEVDFKSLLRANNIYIGILFLELIIFLTLIPYVDKPEKAGRALLTGTFIAGLITTFITLLSIGVLGADFTARNIYPTYILAKKIDIGEFIQRFEAVLAIAWFLSIFYKLLICFYASTLGLIQIFNLKSNRPLIFPLGIITVVLSISMLPNTAYFRTFTAKTWLPFSLTIGFILPIFLLLAAKLRKKTES
ncbi:spore gernimation protein [Bacillus taeanensis]|uniref:Spore gernimation protein n=2 Tax=Bacillus taeanensis TaxID=273032 RepID=A0A366XPE4_9BACI|nr:spore gernimation protein [Bacillus taeanensis]